MFNKKTPNPIALRELLPDVSQNMETEFLSHQLRQLGVKFTRSRVRGEVRFNIPMHPNHEMQISAVDVGPGGFKQFITYTAKPKRTSVDLGIGFELKELIRAHVYIRSTEKGDSLVPYSQTFQNVDIKEILISATRSFEKRRSIEISPRMAHRKRINQKPDDQIGFFE